MGRTKGSKNKVKTIVQEYTENSKLDIFEDTISNLPEDELRKVLDHMVKEEKMTKPAELTNTAFSIIQNPNGTLSCIKIPYDFKTGTFGTPEVIETGDRHDAFFRMKVVTAELWG